MAKVKTYFMLVIALFLLTSVSSILAQVRDPVAHCTELYASVLGTPFQRPFWPPDMDADGNYTQNDVQLCIDYMVQYIQENPPPPQDSPPMVGGTSYEIQPGFPDVNGYCQSIGWDGFGSVAVTDPVVYGVRCGRPNGWTSEALNMDAVCTWWRGRPATAYFTDANNPFSWACNDAVTNEVAQPLNDWVRGNTVGLCSGTEIRRGSSMSYEITFTVSANQWAVVVVNGPRYADGYTWWDISRVAAGDPSGGTGWVRQDQADCGQSGTASENPVANPVTIAYPVFSGNTQPVARINALITASPWLNVRSGPGMDYPVLARVVEGNYYEIVATRLTGWHQIRVGGDLGWISGDWVQVVENPNFNDQQISQCPATTEAGRRWITYQDYNALLSEAQAQRDRFSAIVNLHDAAIRQPSPTQYAADRLVDAGVRYLLRNSPRIAANLTTYATGFVTTAVEWMFRPGSVDDARNYAATFDQRATQMIVEWSTAARQNNCVNLPLDLTDTPQLTFPDGWHVWSSWLP